MPSAESQNRKQKEKDMNTYLGFQCCLEMNHILWFSSYRGKGLFRYDGKKVDHILDFEEEGNRLFADIQAYRGKLIFTPLVSKKIYIYDVVSGELKGIPYGLKGMSGFSVSVLYGQYLYMFPTYYPGILRMNVETYALETIDTWINGQLESCRISEDAYFRGDYVRDGNTLYLSLCNAHAVLEFHLENGHCAIHNVGAQGYSTIASDGKRFWMAPRRKGSIVRWDPVTDEKAEYQSYPEGYQQGNFVGSLYENGYVWMFPETSNQVLKVDTETGRIEEDKLFSDICCHKWVGYSLWNVAFVYMKKESGRILLCTGRSCEIVIFRPAANEIKRFQLELSNEDSLFYQEAPDERYVLFRDKKIKKTFSNENSRYGITGFAEYIAECGEYIEEYVAEKMDMCDLDIGRAIYKNIM